MADQLALNVVHDLFDEIAEEYFFGKYKNCTTPFCNNKQSGLPEFSPQISGSPPQVSNV